MSVKKNRNRLICSLYLFEGLDKLEKDFIEICAKDKKNRDINPLIDISVTFQMFINIDRSFDVIALSSVHQPLFQRLAHLFSTIMLEYS